VDAVKGALVTDAGRALAAEITELLESELVRFAHRVYHDHGIELDRARSSLAVLTVLLRGGLPWTAQADCAPAKLAEAFTTAVARDRTAPALAAAVRAEVEAFTAAAGAVEVKDRPPRSLSDLLRKVGAPPESWWWAGEFGADRARCWKAASASAGYQVQVALAVGIEADVVLRALAGAFTVAATRAKTSRTGPRNDLVALLGRFVATGTGAIEHDRELIAKATALAFEMAAVQQPWWTGADGAAPGRRTADGITEVAVLSFQLVELFTAAATGRRPDAERYGDLAARADRSLSSRGVRLAALLQRELDPAFAAATAS